MTQIVLNQAREWAGKLRKRDSSVVIIAKTLVLELTEECERLQAKQDAAVADFSDVVLGKSICHVCKYDGSEHPHICNVCECYSQWVWRGPQKEANL